jgi:hypothetical protein
MSRSSFGGGGIDLPEPQEVEEPPLEHESLTGVPENPAAQPAQLQLVVPPRLVSAGERVAHDGNVPAQELEVPRLEWHAQQLGSHERVAPSPHLGTSSQPSMGQGGAGPTQPEQHVGRQVQLEQRVGAQVGGPNRDVAQVGGPSQGNAQVGGQLHNHTHPNNIVIRQNSNQAMHPPHIPQSTRVIPPGTNVLSNPQPMPIRRLINTPLPTKPPTHKHRYSLRPRGPQPNPSTMPRPTKPTIGIKRGAPAFNAYHWTPLPIPNGHCRVIPTAFSACAPYAQPKLSKYGIELPPKEKLMEGLLRYFNVDEPTDGPLPVITEAYAEDVPATLKQAMSTKYARHWAEATVEEWLSLIGNDTWVLIEREPWMKVIPCKWVFSIKTDQNGIPKRFKARLVAGGHKQTEGVDYNETYAPVSRLATLRTMLAVAARNGWKVHQLDIKTAFLNGKADTEVYMQQPPGFVDGVGQVVKLQKCLYGLKQAPRVWYLTLCKALRELGLKPVSADSSFWIKEDGDTLVYMTSVVDDILITSANEEASLEIKKGILNKFEGHDCGEATHYNGMKITWLRNEGVVILSQPAHIQRMLDIFVKDINPNEFKTLPAPEGLRLHKKGSNQHDGDSPLLDVTKFPYRQLLGGLNYVACTVRPDIVFIVNQLSRYCNAPTVEHWRVAINVLKYLKYTINWGISLGGGGGMGDVMYKHTPDFEEHDVVAFADANHGTGIDDKKSITGYVLQVYGGSVSWGSKVQSVTSLSTTESEFRALSTASREALWLAKIVTLFGIPTMPFIIKGDNKGSIESIKSYNYTKNSKHVQIRHDFMRDYYVRGELKYEHIKGNDNPADIFTKALGKHKFGEFREKLGMRPVPEGH